MKPSSPFTPRAYEENIYPWHLGLVSPSLEVKGKKVRHPAHTCGIFVVHGIGSQKITETSAMLRSGFEDALDDIYTWQEKNNIPHVLGHPHRIPPPLITEGYWANSENLEDTFPEEWKNLEGKKRIFFARLWRLRALSGFRTFGWFLKQQARLLNPRVALDVGLLSWFMYWALQIVSLTAMTFFRVFLPGVLTRVLSDVRLYVAPEGIVERAIVQRIDYRVGRDFLRMLGLGWDFRSLPKSDRLTVNGKSVAFDRVMWVAHSLGTVISYNVLSDLFVRMVEFERNGDKQQQEGAKKLRNALRRFVTLGSPLDKIAYLFPESLRPWPSEDRQELIEGGETPTKDREKREWWINFYHVLDPVSGALSSSFISGKRPPMNLHIKLPALPGLAHVAYWTDSGVLRFILSRAYGREFLQDREYRPPSTLSAMIYSLVGYVAWTLSLFGAAGLIVWGITKLVRFVF